MAVTLSRLFNTRDGHACFIGCMTDTTFMSRAAAPLPGVVSGVRPDQLTSRTPCSEFDVRRLINHLLFWGPSLEGAAHKKVAAPPGDDESAVDLTRGDWAATLTTQVSGIVEAWSEPEAWKGTTYMGTPMELPAPLIGAMAVGELVVHGWDLARATGQDPSWDDALLEYLLIEVENTAEQGRQMNIYGPEVTVPESAPTLHRALGVTGRDPDWH